VFKRGTLVFWREKCGKHGENGREDILMSFTLGKVKGGKSQSRDGGWMTKAKSNVRENSSIKKKKIEKRVGALERSEG